MPGRMLAVLLPLMALAARPALPCDVGFADEAAVKERWELSPIFDPTKVDEAGQRFLLARCKTCGHELDLVLRATTLSTGADQLSKLVTDPILDDPATRRNLLEAYVRDQVATYGTCVDVAFSGRRKLDGATLAAFTVYGYGNETNCQQIGRFNAIEYLGAKGSCGYRARLTWTTSYYALQPEQFEQVHWLLQQLRWKP